MSDNGNDVLANLAAAFLVVMALAIVLAVFLMVGCALASQDLAFVPPIGFVASLGVTITLAVVGLLLRGVKTSS